jgi:membrane associated rhomboid family serine protease
MRQEEGSTVRFQLRKPTPVVGATLVLLLVIWIVCALGLRFGGEGAAAAFNACVLHPADIFAGRNLWALFTAPLLHSLDDTDHLLFNGLALYFFAPDLEEAWGGKKLMLFMVLAALGGDAFVLAASALHLSLAGGVLGFSGVCMGVTMAWGLVFADRQFYFFFFPMRGLHLVYITLALQVLTALSFSRVSAAAHFGGMTVGALFSITQGGPLRRWWLERKLAKLDAQSAALRGARRAAGPSLRVIRGGADDDPPKDKRYLN